MQKGACEMKMIPVATNKAPAAIGPYSQGIVAGDLVFTSGQIPYTPDGQIAADIAGQTRQALENVKAVLEAAGSSLQQVVKCTVFVADMQDFAIVNQVYAEYFSAPCPARSCIQAAALPKGVGVEIEAIGVIG